jgi:GntR family transcriptional repressor for pyruvate dehydrogenase complex
MERMEVGRSSVREALRGLAVLGMVEIRQGQGTFVKSATPGPGIGAPSVEAIAQALSRGLTEELLEAREIIEVRMASLAAQRATLEDLGELQALVTRAREARNHGQPAFQLGAEFHLGIARAAHNDVLEGFVTSYLALLAERGAALERLPGYAEWEVEEHDAIRQAIVVRDARLAASRMRRHLRAMTIHFEHLAAARRPPGRPRRHHLAATAEAAGG